MAGQIQRSTQNIPAPRGASGPMAMRMAASTPMASLTPKEIVGILRRHIWMIIIFTVLGLFLGTGGFFAMRTLNPKYTAISYIDVSPPVEKDILDQIGSPQINKDLYYQFRLTKAMLIKQQSMLEELLQQDKIRNTQWFKQYAALDAQGNIIGDRNKAIRKSLEGLNDDLSSSAPRDQNLIRISMTTNSPNESTIIVDEMVRIFLAQQRDLARSGISEQLLARKRQRDEIKARITQNEATLDNIRKGTPFARLNTKGQNFRDYMDEKLADIEDSYSNLNARKSNLARQYQTLEQRATGEFDEVVQEEVERDSIVRQIQLTIASTEPILAQQRARFGPNHRRVLETQKALDQLERDLENRKNEIGEITRKSLKQQAEDQLVALTQQLQTYTEQLQQARDDYKAVDVVRAEYAKFEILRDEEQELLNKIDGNIESLNALYDDPKLSKLQSLGAAAMPRQMSSPRIELYVPGGFMLGMLAGIGLAFAIELLNDKVRTPSDVMRHLKAPLLGTICHLEDDEDVESVELSHVVRQAPYSIMSECYRQLRTNLKLAPGGSEHKTLLITSPAAGDGKTSTAVNLSSTMVAENKKVLLIDTNFRRPKAGSLFPRTSQTDALAEHPDFGLSNYLMGQCENEEQIIRPSGIPGLDIIDSGPLPSTPAELLDSTKMKQLLEYCKNKYDHVIIDGPPLLVTDAKSLASQADGTIVVFNAQSTHRGAAMRILRELRDIGANTVGSVLMGVKSRKGGYFQEVYRSYQEYQRVHVNPNIS